MAADSPSTPPAAEPITQDEFHALRAEHRRNKLALAVQRQRQELQTIGRHARSHALQRRDSLESQYYDPSNFVDLTSYLGDGPFGYSLVWSPWLSTRADRDYGRDRPIFQTEQDLMAFRGMARLLAAYNANAIGGIETITSYVVGEGAKYNARPNPSCDADLGTVKPVIRSVQKVIDGFIERNDWDSALSEEKCQRAHIDGEFFEGLWHLGDGCADVRIVEPEQATQPYAIREIEEWIGCDHRRVDWTFGVCADDEDAQNVHGYFVQWTNRDTDWDFLPGGREPFYAPGSQNSWCEHFKLNVPRNVKRGVTDFMCMRELLDLARKVLKNMGTSGSLSSAIAWVIEHAPGILNTQINAMIQSNADATYTQVTQQGQNTAYVKYYQGGTILHTPKGQTYGDAPGAKNSETYINIVEAMLRSCAVRWSMPDHMLTGSADEVNYAAILETGSPFVKRSKRWQARHANHDKRVLWKVVQWACECGVVSDGQGRPCDFETVRRVVSIEVTPPRVDVRDENAETTRNETLKKNGVLSRKTWAGREGLDFEQEDANGLNDEMEELVSAKAAPAADRSAKAGNAAQLSAPSLDAGTNGPQSPKVEVNPAATESLAERSATLLAKAVDSVFGEVYP